MALSNTSAVVVERYEQDEPFGKSHTLDASGNNLGSFASQVHHHKRMHGGVVEEVTGLYDFRNRWYSPESGSWLSRDPLGYVDSPNMTQGLFHSPLRFVDAFGLRGREAGTKNIGGSAIGSIEYNVHSPSSPCTNSPEGCTKPSIDYSSGPPFKAVIDIHINCKDYPQQCDKIIAEEIGHAIQVTGCIERCKSTSGSGKRSILSNTVKCYEKCMDRLEKRTEMTDGGPGKDKGKGHHYAAKRMGANAKGELYDEIKRLAKSLPTSFWVGGQGPSWASGLVDAYPIAWSSGWPTPRGEEPVGWGNE